MAAKKFGARGVGLDLNTQRIREAMDLADKYKVGTLVEGTVAQSGDRLRVSVSLVNAGTGEEVGSTTFDKPRV